MSKPTETNNLKINLSFNGKTEEVYYKFDVKHMSQRHIFEKLKSGVFYEEDLTKFLFKVMREGDTFLDVGAHIGYFSILASYLVSEEGKVIAVEPNSENFAWLQVQIDLNKRQNIKPIKAVVCGADGTVEFFKNSDNDGGHSLWDPGLHFFNKLSKEAPAKDWHEGIRFETIVKQFDVEYCRAVKIDTEGAELIILKSGGNFFSPERVPFVICEINDFGLSQLGTNQMELRSWMKERGYMTFLFSKNDHLPIFVPNETTIVSKFVSNVLFSTPEAMGIIWPAVDPYSN